MTISLSTDLLEQRAAVQRQRQHDSVIELREHLDVQSEPRAPSLAGRCGRSPRGCDPGIWRRRRVHRLNTPPPGLLHCLRQSAKSASSSRSRRSRSQTAHVPDKSLIRRILVKFRSYATSRVRDIIPLFEVTES